MKQLASFLTIALVFCLSTAVFAQDTGTPGKQKTGGNTVQQGGKAAQPGTTNCLPRVYLRTAPIKKGGAPVDKLLTDKPFKGVSPTSAVTYSLVDASGTEVASGWKVEKGANCAVYIDTQALPSGKGKTKRQYVLKMKAGTLADQTNITLEP